MNEASYSGGIMNRGNTCYMSSALQILFRFRPFRKIIKNLSADFKNQPIFSILNSLAHSLKYGKDPINPDSLINFLKIDPGIQCDICEFLTKLLDVLISVDETNKTIPLKDLFYLYSNRTQQNYKDNQIFLTIPAAPNQSIEESINSMLSDNIETIERSPRLLFVHIQRIEFNKETNETTKDSSPMIISDSLRINDETYSIYSIVQHIGRSNSGHYISFIHDSDGWLKCNDSRVTSISASDVFTSSFDERSPAYLVAYVHSFTDVLSIRNRIEAASHSLKLVFFDAKKMKKEAEFESSTNSVTDAISLVKEVKSQWESRFKCTLSTRYQLGNQRMTRDFPHDPGEVLVWFERLSMRNFNPTNVKIEPIRVTFGICDTSLHFNVFFHPEQTTKSVYSFGKRFMTDFLHSRECNLRLYIEIYEQLVIINSDYDKTLFELQCYYEDLRFFISINNPTPRNLMYAKVNLFQTDNKLDQLDPIKYPVHLDETIDCLLDYAKEQLHVGSCVLYSMKYDNEIPTMHEICGNPNLIDVVANEKELRAERSPEVNSNNCYIEGIGICFKFAIESEENIDEIEERIGKYLANYVGSQRVRVAFRVGDMLTRPYVPGEGNGPARRQRDGGGERCVSM